MAGNSVCIVCSKNIGKSVYKIQCSGRCNGWAHLGCTDFKKEDIVEKKKIEWICRDCKKTDKNADSDDCTLEKLIEKIEKRKSLDKIRKTDEGDNIEEMFRKILKKIETLEEAVTFNSDLMDGMKDVMEELRRDNKTMRREQEKMKATIAEMEKEINNLKEQASLNEAASNAQERKKNVIVVGVNRKEEIKKVFRKLEIYIPEEAMKMRQLPSKNIIKPILVSFEDEKTRNLVMENRKKMGTLISDSLELEGEKRRIYINEDLPREVQDLLKKAKELRGSGYRYVWTKENKVFCRKSEYSKILLIRNTNHIEQLKTQ